VTELPTAVAVVVARATTTLETELVVQADLELLWFVTCCQLCRHLTSQQHPTTAHRQQTTSHQTAL
jgi:hypothetical protein